MGLAPGPIPVTRGGQPGAGAAGPAGGPAGAHPGDRRRRLRAAAQRAAESAEAATGIPAAFMVAQAAHESGWGRREIRHADGAPSYNLFGIKAGASWTGPVAEVTTTEYIGGQAHKVTAKFRAYASYAESFADYARLMKNSPRYAAVAQADTPREFAQGLQRAGYATDPAYADKLTRVINTTLRLQRTHGVSHGRITADVARRAGDGRQLRRAADHRPQHRQRQRRRLLAPAGGAGHGAGAVQRRRLLRQGCRTWSRSRAPTTPS